MIKRIVYVITLMIFLCAMMGCATNLSKDKNREDLQFVVLSDDVIPKELKSIIDAKGEDAFKLTYKDDNYLYICIGYGKQKSDGYSIVVDSLNKGSEAIYVSCELLSKNDESELLKDYCPKIVIRTDKSDLPIIFE